MNQIIIKDMTSLVTLESSDNNQFLPPPALTLVSDQTGEPGVPERASTLHLALHLPLRFDSREKWPGCISSPMYQGNCGSCWAFASVGCLSDRFSTSTMASCDGPIKTGSHSSLPLCDMEHTINSEKLNEAITSWDILFGLKKVTFQDLFDRILGIASGTPRKVQTGTIKEACTSESLMISKSQWMAYFNAAFSRYKWGESVQERTQALTDLSLMELGAPIGAYLPVSSKDTLELASKKMELYFKFFDSDRDGYINRCEWMKRTDSPMQLSVQKLILCAVGDVKPGGERTTDNTACRGGTLDLAWRYLKEWGTPLEQCVGYTLSNWNEDKADKDVHRVPFCSELIGPAFDQCPGYIDVEEWQDLLKEIKSGTYSSDGTFLPWQSPITVSFRASYVYSLPGVRAQGGSVHNIQTDILQNGPVSSAYRMYEDFYSRFGGASGMGGQKFEGSQVLGSTSASLIYAWDGKSRQVGGHAVSLIGWGSYRGVAYWIVRNSWGLGWGTSGYAEQPDSLPSNLSGGGYFWMRMGANECGIEENVTAGLADVEGITYPGTVTQVQPGDILARHEELAPGYGCADSLGKPGVCINPGGIRSGPGDVVITPGKEFGSKNVLSYTTTVSPLALFWPTDPESTRKRVALAEEINRVQKEASERAARTFKEFEAKREEIRIQEQRSREARFGGFSSKSSNSSKSANSSRCSKKSSQSYMISGVFLVTLVALMIVTLALVCTKKFKNNKV